MLLQENISNVLGVGEGVALLSLTFVFPPLQSELSMTYGELGDLLTLCIQACSLIYIAIKISRIKPKDKKDNGSDI